MYECVSCNQQGHTGSKSKTAPTKSSSVLNWGCRLTQVDLCDGHKVVLCCACVFISYMVDASDIDKIEASRNELHNLLAKPQLEGIPVLVLGNKRDLPTALDEKEIIERM